MNSFSIFDPMAISHPMKRSVTSGRCLSISLLMVEAFHTKIPAFQKNSPVLMKRLAISLSGFSVNVFTAVGLPLS